MANALDTSRFIIASEAIHGRAVTNLRLQKLLYFIQARSLVVKQVPFFLDRMEAWPFGPVVPSVYREYKIYGGAAIPPDNGPLEGLSFQAQHFIEETANQGASLSTPQLVDITHSQDPWKNAIEAMDNEITPQAIAAYYAKFARQ